MKIRECVRNGLRERKSAMLSSLAWYVSYAVTILDRNEKFARYMQVYLDKYK